METWDQRLARLRSTAGLTQRQVAAALGIKSPSVAQWESGRSRPDLTRLTALAALYKVSLQELCGTDFPGLAQDSRVELLLAFDAMDGEARSTLLRVARSLAKDFSTQSGKSTELEQPAFEKLKNAS
jgi:transcriptional regulator with XRE-family HTH domain